jgi:hypothetical protein
MTASPGWRDRAGASFGANNSTCPQCGEDIVWAQRRSGRTAPPLERVIAFDGPLMTIKNGVLVDIDAVYRLHVCGPERVALYAEERERVKEEIEEYEQDRDAAWAEAIHRPCPKCEALAEDRCLNLLEKRRGRIKATRWPHPERHDPAWLARNKRQYSDPPGEAT